MERFDKAKLDNKYADPRDNPDNCPRCGTHLVVAWEVRPGFNEYKCPSCCHYYTHAPSFLIGRVCSVQKEEKSK